MHSDFDFVRLFGGLAFDASIALGAGSGNEEEQQLHFTVALVRCVAS